jgi:hypothetical protein
MPTASATNTDTEVESKVPDNPFDLGKTVEFTDKKRGLLKASEVLLRDPVFAEADDFGLFFDDEGQLDFEVLSKWIARLSGLPEDMILMFPNRIPYHMAEWITSKIEIDDKPITNPMPIGKTVEYAGPNGVETVSEFSLREPTWRETRTYGTVVKRDGTPDYKALKNWVVRLSGLPGDAVRQFPIPVMLKVVGWIKDDLAPAGARTKNSP